MYFLPPPFFLNFSQFAAIFLSYFCSELIEIEKKLLTSGAHQSVAVSPDAAP
jgi:hypothetical protein